MTFAQALQHVTDDEAKALIQALDQYVENAHADCSDDGPYADDPLLTAAESVLERLNGVIAGLADQPPSTLLSASGDEPVPAG